MSLSFKLIDTELEAFLKPRDSDHKILWLFIYRQQIGFDIYVDFGFINTITAPP